MFPRKKISPERQAITGAQANQLAEARRKDAEHREMMLDAMRGLGFEAICQTFAGHVLGRPDVTPVQVHDELQRMARTAWAEIPAE